MINAYGARHSTGWLVTSKMVTSILWFLVMVGHPYCIGCTPVAPPTDHFVAARGLPQSVEPMVAMIDLVARIYSLGSQPVDIILPSGTPGSECVLVRNELHESNLPVLRVTTPGNDGEQPQSMGHIVCELAPMCINRERGELTATSSITIKYNRLDATGCVVRVFKRSGDFWSILDWRVSWIS